MRLHSARDSRAAITAPISPQTPSVEQQEATSMSSMAERTEIGAAKDDSPVVSVCTIGPLSRLGILFRIT
jgi:hypothetical protein